MPRDITAIYMGHDMGSNIARSRISTGEVWVNAKRWPHLKENEKAFVLFHELGHIRLKTKDEHRADQFAAEKYFEAGFSLKGSIDTLLKLLEPVNAEKAERRRRMLLRALLYDWRKNGNTTALRTFKRIRK